MKTILILITILFFSVSGFSAVPKAAQCDGEQAEKIARKLIEMNVLVKYQKDIEIRGHNLDEFGYDENKNEITKYTVKWGYKSGEMSFETYSLEIGLSSSFLLLSDRCAVKSMKVLDIVD